MEFLIELQTDDFMRNDTAPHSEFPCDLQGSHSTRMVVVSDADEDDEDASLPQPKRIDSIGNEAVGTVGTSSRGSATDSMALDACHRVTPLIQDSEETLARATPVGNTQIGNDTILPLCPSSFPLSDDNQTIPTIQPRGLREHSSQTKLVDKYAVKYDRYNHEESTERHDFNACRALKPSEDTRDAKKGIHRNLFDMNLAAIPHKIADGTTSTTKIPNGHNKQQKAVIINPSQSQNHHNCYHHRKNLIQPQTHHKISPYENQKEFTNAINMPSKVAHCLPRQRSRAIAIKRSRPGQLIDPAVSRANQVDKEARRGDTELYDYATWRMYNRIVDHRRKNPLPIHYQEDHLSQDQQHSHRTLKTNQLHRPNQRSMMDEQTSGPRMLGPSITHGQRYFVRNNPLYNDDDYVSGDEDDEIFDFEL